VGRRNVACFAGGLVALLVALESPLDGVSANLFAAHMVQHLLLIVVTAPLLVLAAPLAPMLWGLPEPIRRRLGGWWRHVRFLTRPISAFALHSVALWAWHIPLLYEAALGNRAIHVFEHATFLVTASLFWFAVLRVGRVAYGVSVLYVFGMALETTILGALLAFAPAPWYPSHHLDDQQLAGLIMWVPGGGAYLAAVLGLFAAWLKDQTNHGPPTLINQPPCQPSAS
jgi:putative membrane protein